MNINSLIKRKQLLWLSLVAATVCTAIAAGWYLSDIDRPVNASNENQSEPAPDMTGVVDATFDDKVQQHATTEMQVAQSEMTKEFKRIDEEIELLSKGRLEDQKQLELLASQNANLKTALGNLGHTHADESATLQPAPLPGPEGEPQPLIFPPEGRKGQVPPPTVFYPGAGATPPPQIRDQPIPVPNRIIRKTFHYGEAKKAKTLPYIPSGSFANAVLIEGADANASVTGNESTVPMELRLIGSVEMPNNKTFDLTGCFVGLEAWGDVSSERAIVRTRNISCLRGGKTIDQPIKGHVSFRGKNGVKGEVVMRNGKILGWAGAAGFLDGIGEGMKSVATPSVGIGGSASIGAGDVFKSGLGGGGSKAAQSLSDYYIKRAEQYHPVIPIGAGNEVTVVFQDGFQLRTIEEVEYEKSQSRQNDSSKGPERRPEPATPGGMIGVNTDQMLQTLGKLDPRQFMANEE